MNLLPRLWQVLTSSIETKSTPPSGATWWFGLVAILLIIALGYFVIYRRLSDTNRQLEQRIAERTRMLQETQRQLQLVNARDKENREKITTLANKLHEQAIHDPLTGLYNRTFLTERLGPELKRAERGKHNVAFLLVGLDRFKEVNEIYGHAAGDQALGTAASVIAGYTRLSDIACRFGGEEFLAILPEISVEDTLRRAEQLRSDIANLEILYGDYTIHITASIGIAIYPLQGTSGDELLSHVDVALRQAKSAGRDKVAIYNPPEK